jgi:hypothetical protein
MRSASFFASTTLIIIGGLLAALGRSDQAVSLLNALPLAVKTSPLLWDLKILLLAILFVYAFFKFTWAFRQYNYCLILIGAVALPDRLTEEATRIATRTAQIAPSTARHFNGGMRAYYFGLAAGSSTRGCSYWPPPGWWPCSTGASSAPACWQRWARPRTRRRTDRPAPSPGQALRRWASCRPSANSSMILALNAGMSPGFRLVTRP